MYDNYYDISNPPFDFDDYGISSSILEPELNDLGTAIGGIFAFIVVFYLFILVICGIMAIIKYIGAWKMYKKAGLDGWEALIPIHSIVMEFKLAGIKTYWYFLLLVPIANIVVSCWKDIELAKAYGKSTAFGIGLFLLNPIFTAILGLGKAEYIGPQSAETSATTNSTSVTTASVESETSPAQPVQESLFEDSSKETPKSEKKSDDKDTTKK